MLLEFGPWRPDLHDSDTGVTEATNVIPWTGSYEPMSSLVAFSQPLENICLGALSLLSSGGSTFWFAGDVHRLYMINSSTLAWTDVDKSLLTSNNVSVNAFSKDIRLGSVPIVSPHGYGESIAIGTAIAQNSGYAPGFSQAVGFGNVLIISAFGYGESFAAGSTAVNSSPIDVNASAIGQSIGFGPIPIAAAFGYAESIVFGGTIADKTESVVGFSQGTSLGRAPIIAPVGYSQHIFEFMGVNQILATGYAQRTSLGSVPISTVRGYRESVMLGSVIPQMQTARQAGIAVPSGDLNSYVTNLGVQWVRRGLRWINAEAVQGTYDWSEHDAVVAQATAIGVKFVANLGNAPVWARSDPGNPLSYPNNLQDYINYVTAIVNRYGTQVYAWEIWNEPQGNGLTAVQYATMLKAASAAVKAVSASARVVGFAMNGTFKDGNSPTKNTWCVDVLNTPNVLDNCDEISIHLYCRPEDPYIGDTRGPIPTRLDNSASLLSTYGWNKPCWATEGGWPTEPDTLPGYVTEAKQADYIVKLCDICHARGILYFVYQLYGSITTTESGGMGLIRPNLTLKPSYNAYRNWIGTQQIHSFYMTSYDTDATTGAAASTRLDALPTGTTHAILTVHVRAIGNTVTRDSISENPANLANWFALVRSKGLEPALSIILFENSWDWAGFWNPSNPATALANYYTCIRPYVLAAQTANLPFIILVDEWSTLYSKASAVTAFTTLFTSARADYSGQIALNVSNMEEADILPQLPALTDFMGVNAYVPISTVNNPTVADMVENLVGTSSVPAVLALVNTWRTAWGDATVIGYMSYIRHLAVLWNRPIIFTTGYKSTVGAAIDPSGQPETTADNTIQSNCWRAFLTAASTVGSALIGTAVWRGWTGTADDDGATGFSVQNKPASSTIAEFWMSAAQYVASLPGAPGGPAAPGGFQQEVAPLHISVPTTFGDLPITVPHGAGFGDTFGSADVLKFPYQYSVSANGAWSFTQYGDNVYATNYNDPIQVYSLGSGGRFNDLGGDAPRARRLGVVKNFLVAVNTVDSDGIIPQRVRWSGLDQPNTWTVNATTQADFQDLFGDGGANQNIVAGLTQADAVVVQERAVWRMVYTGPPFTFQFDMVEGIRGTPAAGSMIGLGGLVYYLGEDGFYVFDGAQSVPIGSQRIDRTFFIDADPVYYHRMSSVADLNRKLIFWSYASTDATSGVSDRILVYNWGTGEWSRLNVETEFLWRTQSFGVTLENLDSFGDVDTIQTSFDSRQWQGGIYQLSAFNSAHHVAHFSGTNLAATIATREITMSEPRRLLVTQTWPHVEAIASDIKIGIGRRTLANDSVSFAASTAVNVVGFCPQRLSDSYIRYRMSISAEAVWERATGIDAMVGGSGSVR